MSTHFIPDSHWFIDAYDEAVSSAGNDGMTPNNGFTAVAQRYAKEVLAGEIDRVQVTGGLFDSKVAA